MRAEYAPFGQAGKARQGSALFKLTHYQSAYQGRGPAHGGELRQAISPSSARGAPKSATPPNFNGPKQIAMVVRQFASAIGR